jgi:hypothetical protein
MHMKGDLFRKETGRLSVRSLGLSNMFRFNNFRLQNIQTIVMPDRIPVKLRLHDLRQTDLGTQDTGLLEQGCAMCSP